VGSKVVEEVTATMVTAPASEEAQPKRYKLKTKTDFPSVNQSNESNENERKNSNENEPEAPQEKGLSIQER
jgi:hypothetical protein